VRDALELQVTFCESIALPDAWRHTASDESDSDADGAPAAQDQDALELVILVHDRQFSSVAHFLSLSVDKRAIAYWPGSGEYIDDTDGGSVDLGNDQSMESPVPLPHFWHARLPPRFVARADTLEFTSHAGCGSRRADGRRAVVPWLTALTKDIDMGPLLPEPMTVSRT